MAKPHAFSRPLAFAAAKGDGEKVTQLLRDAGRHDLAEAMDQGVLDGFVSSEQILKQIHKGGVKGWTGKLWDMPGVIFQGVEQRGRLGTFLDADRRGFIIPETIRNLPGDSDICLVDCMPDEEYVDTFVVGKEFRDRAKQLRYRLVRVRVTEVRPAAILRPKEKR